MAFKKTFSVFYLGLITSYVTLLIVPTPKGQKLETKQIGD